MVVYIQSFLSIKTKEEIDWNMNSLLSSGVFKKLYDDVDLSCTATHSAHTAPGAKIVYSVNVTRRVAQCGIRDNIISPFKENFMVSAWEESFCHRRLSSSSFQVASWRLFSLGKRRGPTLFQVD